MLSFKDTKRLSIVVLAALVVMVLTFVMATSVFADEAPDNAKGNIISSSETWVTPYKHVEVTVYDLGDGFTSTETTTTETITDKDGISPQASGEITQKKDVEIKNGSAVAATITVSGTFSYNGSSATVKSASHSRSIKAGYTETSWSTNKGNSGLFNDAYVGASLTVKQTSTSKTHSGSAKVTCSKNGD